MKKMSKSLLKTNTLVILLTTLFFDIAISFLRESSSVAETDHLKLEPRIIGGQYVPEKGFYPFIVNIEYFKSHLCGGAVYDRYTVISAAQCFDDDIKRRRIRLVFGDHNQFLKEKENEVRRKVKLVLKHPDFNENTFSHDIAILKLWKPLPFNHLIQPITLPNRNVESGEMTTAMGWGTTSKAGENDILRHVMVPALTSTDCRHYYGGKLDDTMICTYNPGKDTCLGDAGGPLVRPNANGAFELVGIVSWGDGCAQKNKPGVYVNAYNYEAWIIENSGRLKKSLKSEAVN